jgi:hypothetical protein
MAAASGLKPFETDAMPPVDVWVMIEGYNERMRTEWEMTRAVCFNVARFGNSDPKKFPKTPEKFWPLPWDKVTLMPAKTILEQHARMVAIRKSFEEKKK